MKPQSNISGALLIIGVLLTANQSLAGEVSPVGPTCVPPPQDFDNVARLEPLGDIPSFPMCEHVDQSALSEVPFAKVFEAGDLLFDTPYSSADGVGANLRGDPEVSLRFSRFPRADLPGFKNRATGPNGRSCTECHNKPLDDGAADPALNAIRDPLHSADKTKWIDRNTPHIFGQAGLQLAAEEMTRELQAIREATRLLAVRSQVAITAPLTAKGIAFGTVRALPGGRVIDVFSTAVDRDLIVRPFQWKGNMPFVRAFVRDASHNEIGMQGVELVGAHVDADGDGVADEFSVGDMTALTVYVAAQNPPRRSTWLAANGYGPPVAGRVQEAVATGEMLFASIGCTECHTQQLTIANHVYTEPSQHPLYRDAMFADGPPKNFGLDPETPVRFDLLTDIIPAYPRDPATGGVVLELYSDLRRHDLGPGMAEPIDETGCGASVFLTRPLWGIGDTSPYLHDGRATTLTDAIKFHGGEAAASRASFLALSPDDRAAVIEFLKDLVIFKPK